MTSLTKIRLQSVLCFTFAVICAATAVQAAPQVLVADRLTGRVLSYNASGDFAGVVVDDPNNLDEPIGLALSKDRTTLYVTSRQGNSVVRYDFNGTTAANPLVISDSSIDIPARVLLSDSGDTLYVSNLGPTFSAATVAQFDPNGVSAGPDLTGGGPTGRTGLALHPDGSLLVGSFQDGGVLKYDPNSSQFQYFIAPDFANFGAGDILVVGGDIYVAFNSFAAGFGAVQKYDADGTPDAGFGPIQGLDFPASLTLSPDGSGFLLGVLGVTDGTGTISKYSFDGAFLGEYAPNSSADPNQGFVEAAGLLTIFDPADFNKDGAIDGDDLAVWETAYGATGAGDADFDGDTDGLDFLIWQREAPQIFETFHAVPEPAGGVLALAAVCLCGRRVRRV